MSGAVQPTPAQPMQAGGPPPPAPGAVAPRESTMFTLGLQRNLDAAMVGRLLDWNFPDVSLMVSRQSITVISTSRPALEACHTFLLNDPTSQLTDEIIDSIDAMETFTVRQTIDLGTSTQSRVRRYRHRVGGGRVSAGSPARTHSPHLETNTVAPSPAKRRLDGDGQASDGVATRRLPVSSAAVEGVATAAGEALPLGTSCSGEAAAFRLYREARAAGRQGSSAPPPVPVASTLVQATAPEASRAPPPVTTAAAPCAPDAPPLVPPPLPMPLPLTLPHTGPPPHRLSWVAALAAGFPAAAAPAASPAPPPVAVASTPPPAASLAPPPPPPPGPPPGPRLQPVPFAPTAMPWGLNAWAGSAAARGRSVPISATQQTPIIRAESFDHAAGHLWLSNCTEVYELLVDDARATVWPGRGQLNSTSVICYIPGAGGLPTKFMDFSAKEMKGSQLIDQYRFHTMICLMAPGNWKKPVHVWVILLLRALIAHKPAGRELRLIGFSRGAWWGTQILRQLDDPAGLDAVLLVGPYGCLGDGAREGAEIGQLLARCGRGLMVASMRDSSNPWTTWGPWCEGVQRQSQNDDGVQRVIIVDDWTHEELRTLLVVGGPIDKGGAEDVFALRANLRI